MSYLRLICGKMDKFGKKWQQRYVKKSTSSHVDGYRDPVDIAEQFQQAFTSSNFDSYADKKVFLS